MTAKTGNRVTNKDAGFTLVELMVSLLIVGIVMMGWWRIMNATSPYREAQRRAAVEVAAGILDAFPSYKKAANWKVDDTCGFSEEFSRNRQNFPDLWLPSDSLIRYVLITTNH